MKKLKIEVIKKKPEKIYGLLSHVGQITIGDYKETFIMPLDNWTLEEYQQQWKEGLERIKSHAVSCLITSVQNLGTRHPSIEMWILYKEGKTIFIQQSLLINETVEHSMKLSEFNSKTCYQFIDPRETITESGQEISEWSINISDINE
jgi:hypothetical protein